MGFWQILEQKQGTSAVKDEIQKVSSEVDQKVAPLSTKEELQEVLEESLSRAEKTDQDAQGWREMIEETVDNVSRSVEESLSRAEKTDQDAQGWRGLIEDSIDEVSQEVGNLSIGSLRDSVGGLSHRLDSVEVTADHAEKGVLELGGRQGSNNDERTTETADLAVDVDCDGQRAIGNTHINGDDAPDQSAATLSAAPAGSVNIPMTFRIESRTPQGEFISHTRWPRGYHPKIVRSNTVADTDVEDVWYRMIGEKDIAPALTGDVAWDGTLNLVGTGTLFLTELSKGDAVLLDQHGTLFEVATIVDDLNATIYDPHGHTPPTGSGSGLTKKTKLPRAQYNGTVPLMVTPDTGAGKDYLTSQNMKIGIDPSGAAGSLSAAVQKDLTINTIA